MFLKATRGYPRERKNGSNLLHSAQSDNALVSTFYRTFRTRLQPIRSRYAAVFPQAQPDDHTSALALLPKPSYFYAISSRRPGLLACVHLYGR
jgi:hypothetical protein